MRARADCYLPSDSVETSQVVSLASGLSHTVEPLEARAVESRAPLAPQALKQVPSAACAIETRGDPVHRGGRGLVYM
jgi:hypothetical protein